MNLINNWLDRLIASATWAKAWAWLAASQIVYWCMLLGTIPHVETYADGMKILDMKQSGYTPAYVKSLLDQLGEPGRAAYLKGQLPLDLVYPALMALAGVWFIAILAKRTWPKLAMLALFPVLAAACDYAENASIMTLLLAYPTVSPGIAQLASVFTIAKSMFSICYFGILGIMFLLYLWRKASRAGTRHTG